MSTNIEWTDETWNPTVGCDRISPGCAHCYAKTLHDKRHKAVLAGKNLAPQYAQPFETLQLMEDRLDAPLHWRRPRRVFVNSVSDLFHADVPDAFIDRVFAVMALAPRHTFQILTKRAERMRDYLTADGRAEAIARCLPTYGTEREWFVSLPLPNVWLGVSVENQRFADERIPLLLQTPAAVRFISAEPLLGPVTIREHLMAGKDPARCANCGKGHGFTRCPNYGGVSAANDESRCSEFKRQNFALGWVIVGGESGAGARPFDIAWARSIVAQCQAAGVPVFVKQLGACPIVPAGRLRHWEWGGEIGREARFEATDPLHESSAPWRVVLDDCKGGDPSEWPEDLRVREFPRVGVLE